MEPKTNYTIVGLVVMILVGALIAAGLWLSVGFEQKKYNTYVVHIREAVSGLSEQSAVKYNGVKVGYVSQIKLSHEDPRRVEMLLNIEEGTPITVSTAATLISQGITGNTYVGLSADSSDLTPLKAAPGQEYPVIPAKPSIFNQLDRVLKEVSENVNKVSIKLSKVFSDKNIQNFHKALANVNTFTHTIASNSEHIDQSLKNVDVVIKNFKEASAEFPEIATELKAGLAQFTKMASSLTLAGSKVSTTMQSGKTAFDKLSQQASPLIQRLDFVASNLEKISEQIRQNPSVVIRGSTPPPQGREKNKMNPLIIVLLGLIIAACSPVKTAVSNLYKLDAYSPKRLSQSHSNQSILITMPEATAGYQFSTMLYVKKPFELASFANNAWVDQPAHMLMPLLAQSLQSSNYFYAVSSSINSEHTDYRLDTQLIELQQNFMKKPSQIEIVVKVVLSHISDNRVIASRVLSEYVNSPTETPYGGVIAANLATKHLTARISDFVVTEVKQDFNHSGS